MWIIVAAGDVPECALLIHNGQHHNWIVEETAHAIKGCVPRLWLGRRIVKAAYDPVNLVVIDRHGGKLLT
jgi:hypothetical protein